MHVMRDFRAFDASMLHLDTFSVDVDVSDI